MPATVSQTEDMVIESLEEHHIVKWVLSELVDLAPSDERFDAKVTVLIENVRQHVKEEEQEFFPKVRDRLGRKALADLGEALEDAEKSAPTKPHPRSPDEPPSDAVVGAITSVVDRVGDNISGLAQGGVTAVQDLIGRILGSDKPKAAPTGSTTARKRAEQVRKATSDVINAGQRAVRGTRSTGARKTSAAKKSAARKLGSPPKTGGRSDRVRVARSAAVLAQNARR